VLAELAVPAVGGGYGVAVVEVVEPVDVPVEL
jgi:hypothetical protein